MSSYTGWLRAGAADPYDGLLRPEGADSGGPTFLDASGGAKAAVKAGGTAAILVTPAGGASATGTAGGTAAAVIDSTGGARSTATAGGVATRSTPTSPGHISLADRAAGTTAVDDELAGTATIAARPQARLGHAHSTAVATAGTRGRSSVTTRSRALGGAEAADRRRGGATTANEPPHGVAGGDTPLTTLEVSND